MKKSNGRKQNISAIQNWWGFMQTGLSYYTFKTIVKSFLPKRKHESKSLYPTDLVNLIKMKYTIHMREMLWLSLGENCLPDIILQRHGVKSFSTPYSYARSNLDHALLLEKSGYHGFLDPKNLGYSYGMETKKVVRSLSIRESDAIYDEMHIHGFEFTHHDIIASQKERESMQRKISRLQTLKGKKNFVFFYHHRANERSDIERIFEKARKFREYYAIQGKTCQMVIFSQKIIHDISEKKLEYKKIDQNIHFFDFFVQHYWRWNSDYKTVSIEKNQIDFFAINDDDLIKKMMYIVNDLILQNKEISEGII